MHKIERDRIAHHRKTHRPSNANAEVDEYAPGGYEIEEWNRFLTRNTMNEELMNFNCSSILPLREAMMAEFSGIQTKQTDLLEFEKNEEKDIEVNFINFLTPKDYEEDEDTRQGKLPTVAEEAPPDELNKSFSGAQGPLGTHH